MKTIKIPMTVQIIIEADETIDVETLVKKVALAFDYNYVDDKMEQSHLYRIRGLWGNLTVKPSKRSIKSLMKKVRNSW